MASTALYRRFRPQTFEEVLGQEHVTVTLQNAIREGRVGHAYLFSGSRGTGKTSTARILAKALNCERGPSPVPCNGCDTCRAITEGSSLDVIEIDAASHGGVEDVRELRENAVLAPAVARKKVYIVDEAHMVSPAGWNAFLKTVEEPPEHVIFVFATTEPHKVLPTILSRCQRFDFRRVSTEQIADHLAKICAEEGIEAQESALQSIARAAEGGVRDALSTLDQLASSGSVTLEATARLLGTATGDSLFEFAGALAASDTGAAVRLVARLVESGQDLRVFTRSLVDHLRALLFIKQVDDPGDLIDVNEETRARLALQADLMRGGKLVHLLKLFVDALSEMRQQAAPRLTLELAAVRATMPEVDESATAAIARIERLERLLEVGRAPGEAARETPAPAQPTPQAGGVPTDQPSQVATPRAVPPRTPEEAPKDAPPAADDPPSIEAAADLLDIEKLRRSWPLLLEEVRKRSRKLHSLLADARAASIEHGVLTVEVRYAIHGEMLTDVRHARLLSEAMTVVYGTAPKLEPTVAAPVADDGPDEIDEARDPEPLADPTDVLKAAFGDLQVEE